MKLTSLPYLRIAILAVLAMRVTVAQGESAADFVTLTRGAAIPLPTVDVNVPHLTTMQQFDQLTKPGRLPTIFVVFPNEKDPRVAGEVRLAKGLSLEIGTAGRVVIADQAAQPQIVAGMLGGSSLKRNSVTRPVWLFFRPSSPPGVTPTVSKQAIIYDESTKTGPMTQIIAETQIVNTLKIDPITGAEVASLADWNSITDTAGVDSPNPQNSFLLTLWYRGGSKNLPAPILKATWKPRLLMGVERWKYRKRTKEGDTVAFAPLLRGLFAINIEAKQDVYRQVFGDAPIPDEPQIILFKLGINGKQSEVIRYKPSKPTDPPTSELTEVQLQAWLTGLGVPAPDNGNVDVAELELARLQQLQATQH